MCVFSSSCSDLLGIEMAEEGESLMRQSVVSNSFRLARSKDTKVDATSVVADIVAMGTRWVPETTLYMTHAPSRG